MGLLPLLASSFPRSPFSSTSPFHTDSMGASKKWSKGKARDKLNNASLFNKDTHEKLLKEIPSAKLITPAVVSDRLKIKGSLARARPCPAGVGPLALEPPVVVAVWCRLAS